MAMPSVNKATVIGGIELLLGAFLVLHGFKAVFK